MCVRARVWTGAVVLYLQSAVWPIVLTTTHVHAGTANPNQAVPCNETDLAIVLTPLGGPFPRMEYSKPRSHVTTPSHGGQRLLKSGQAYSFCGFPQQVGLSGDGWRNCWHRLTSNCISALRVPGTDAMLLL